MLMFPLKFKDMKSEPEKTCEEIELSPVKVINKKKFDGPWQSLKRLSTNYVLIFHALGGVFRIIGLLGYYIIKPKYIELQYRQSAASASLFTGTTSVVTMASPPSHRT